MNNESNTFDYVIVGAGSSGSVLADRLSRDGKSSVLLLEAGGDNESELVRMPRAFMKMWGNPAYFWQFPVKAQKDRPENETWVYGRGLGGSSSTNGTWYLRGMHEAHAVEAVVDSRKGEYVLHAVLVMHAI